MLAASHEDGRPFTWFEVRDEVMTSFVAGSESTAATLAYALDRIARDARVRERLLAAIDSGDDDA